MPVPELVGHAEHAAEPVAVLNVPAPHAEGVPPLLPVNPAAATQAVIAVEPVVLPVPELVGQLVHAAEPDATLKVAAAQAVTELPAPVWPASATQALSAVEPVVLPVAELVGHAVHAAAEAVVALNVFAAQAVTEPAEPV